MPRQCLKRQLTPDDIARVVLFFAADDSGACTNQNTSSMAAGSDHSRCRSGAAASRVAASVGCKQSVAKKCHQIRGSVAC